MRLYDVLKSKEFQLFCDLREITREEGITLIKLELTAMEVSFLFFTDPKTIDNYTRPMKYAKPYLNSEVRHRNPITTDKGKIIYNENTGLKMVKVDDQFMRLWARFLNREKEAWLKLRGVK
jgi:hypothetical protein